MPPSKMELPKPKQEGLLATLKARFDDNKARHPGLDWARIEKKLKGNPAAMWSLNEMERTGGEPDVVALDKKSEGVTFVDCSPESPSGRRSLCFDAAALASRKTAKPKDSAVNLAQKMGVDLLSEDEYRRLQTLGEFDLKTSSWIQTPPEVRKLGGALFMDRRYNKVFLYHNGAESYYQARGFRSALRL
jgi:hypothetical protein